MSVIFTVNSYTNSDEYDDQSTYTEAIGVFDNLEVANQAAADAYLHRYAEQTQCLEEDTVGLGERFSVSLGEDYSFDVETLVKSTDPADIISFFTEKGETIWPAEMGSCTQTFCVEVDEFEVQSSFYLTDEQKRTDALENYIDAHGFTPNNEELDRYIHHELTTHWSGPSFIPNKENSTSEHNIL